MSISRLLDRVERLRNSTDNLLVDCEERERNRTESGSCPAPGQGT